MVRIFASAEASEPHVIRRGSLEDVVKGDAAVAGEEVEEERMAAQLQLLQHSAQLQPHRLQLLRNVSLSSSHLLG